MIHENSLKRVSSVEIGRVVSISQSSAFRIEWIDTAAHIPAELWQACFPSPLEGAWHYHALEGGVCASEMTFAYGVIHQGRRMIGIIPTFLGDAPLAAGLPRNVAAVVAAIERTAPRLLRAKTLFVGSPTAVCGSIGLRPNTDILQMLECITRTLRARARENNAHLIVWKGFSSPNHADFKRVITSLGFQDIPDYPGTSMRIPRSWDAYLSSLNGHHRRYRLRKKLRESHEAAALTTEVLRSPDAAALAEIHALYVQTYERATHKLMRLTPAYFHRIAEAEAAHFVLLRDSQSARIVAFMLCFIMQPRAINGTIGLDYRFVRSWNLHFRLWEAAFGFMISTGATEVHSGQTTYRFKSSLGHDLTPMTIYAKHRNPIINRLVLPLMRGTMERMNWADL